MKHLIAIAMIFTIMNTVNGQIKLTKEFNLVKPAGESFREYFFSNGRINFHSYAINQQKLSEFEVLENAKKDGSDGLMLETKDKLVVYTGKRQDGKFYYEILVPSGGVLLRCTSYNNDNEFSNSSIWLLKKVRELRKKRTEDYSFTN